MKKKIRFKNRYEYFEFVNKNRNKKINVFIVMFTKRYIKCFYEFDEI